MKKREYIILIILLLWFWIVIYQNNKILEDTKTIVNIPEASYRYMVNEWVLDNDLELIKSKLNWIEDNLDSYWWLIYRLVEYNE